jgi:hypothetical protein
MCYEPPMKIATTLLFVLGVLGACGGSKTAPASESVTPTTEGTGSAAASPDANEIANEAYGATCSATAPCATGLNCTKYYGIAGPSGPAFESCEISCADGKACPGTTSCVTIADGPGMVCRPKT